ncbi:zinc-ribbon domain containing protein [bacterium]|nr:zinc-ribbon domain containing protein [bacterium]MBU1652831.1 zinc-ribbon domain containing protein [bacterium]MBU1881865.1 zinc-ribbon domain containing protein [bacterium]
MELNDTQIQCSTCGRDFIFTVKEQEFFNSKGFKAPKHCRECRQKRKHDRERLYTASTTGGAASGRQHIKVVCAVCSRETTVPFKPITGKPVLCKDCFIAQKYGSRDGVETAEKVVPEAEPSPPEAVERPSAASAAIPQDEQPIDLHAVDAAGTVPPAIEAPAVEGSAEPKKDSVKAEPEETAESPSEVEAEEPVAGGEEAAAEPDEVQEDPTESPSEVETEEPVAGGKEAQAEPDEVHKEAAKKKSPSAEKPDAEKEK